MTTTSRRAPIAANLRRLQEQSGLSNEALAQKAGVSLRLLQRWRAGTHEPRYESLLKLAEVLGQDVSSFYEDAA